MRKDSDDPRTPPSNLLAQLSLIFPSCIIVDQLFVVKIISPAIVDLLGFSKEEVVGQSIAVLSHAVDFRELIEKKLSNGYFHNYEVYLRNAVGRNIFVTISAFCSRSLSPDSDYIILDVESIEEKQVTELRLLEKTRQLESLLDCAWHDLRGPIATIKGIINLANLRKDGEEVNIYFQWIAKYTEKLDEELQKLLRRVHLLSGDEDKIAKGDSG